MRYALSDLEHLQGPKDTVTEKLKVADLPSMAQVRALATWDEGLLEKFDRTEVTGIDRSGAMAELSYLMAEHGWSDEQMFVGLTDVDDRWGKFVGRYNRQTILTDLVNRARQKVGYGYSAVDAAAIVARIEGGGARPNQTTYRWGDFVKREIHVSWLLEGLLPYGGVGLLVAPPGTGKSQMALNLAAHVATGRARYLHWPILGGPQRVWWLSLEMNEAGTAMFMRTMGGGYKEQGALQENFFVEPLGEAMPLDQEAGQKWFEEKLVEFEPDLVVIDSLQMVVSKEMTDEKAMKDMTGYLASARKKHGFSMLMVHHQRKKSTEAAKKNALELDDVYGSRYITAGVDFVLALDKVADNVLNVRTLKNRYARMDHDFEVMRDDYLMFETKGEGAMNMAGASGL